MQVLLVILVVVAAPETRLNSELIVNGDSEWIAPRYEISEPWAFSPIDLVSPRTTYLGRVSETFDTSSTWQITLLGSDRLVVFEDSLQVRSESIEYTPAGPGSVLSVSPNGQYLLLFNRDFSGSAYLLEIQNMRTSTGNLLEDLDPRWASVIVADNGIIAVRGGQVVWLYNSDLQPVYRGHGGRNVGEWFASNDLGTRFFFTRIEEVFCLDSSGQLIWSSIIDDNYNIEDSVLGFATDPNGNVLVTIRRGYLQIFNGESGEEIYTEQFDKIVVEPVFSPSGHFLALETKTYDDQLNFRNGICLYKLESDSTISIQFRAYHYTSVSMRFRPIAVSDSGEVLIKLELADEFDYRLLLLDSTGHMIWLSEPVEYGNIQHCFMPENSRFAGMSKSGSELWYFDGGRVHFLTMED